LSNIRINKDSNLVRKIILLISDELGEKYESVTLTETISYNWSYIILVSVNAINKTEQYVIKIPKINNQQRITEAICNDDNAGQSLKEFKCLSKLYDNAGQKNKITVVRPLCYLSDINGILLEKMRGDKLFDLIRRNRISKEKISNLLYRVGSFLSQCHNVYGVRNEDIFLGKIKLGNRIKNDFENKIVIHSECTDTTHNVYHTTMLLGFEIRNIFYCIETDAITMHDLQEVKDRPVCEDIAQFVVSLDLINWGKFFPTRLPINCYRSFIDGYFSGNEPKIDLLPYYIVKEHLRFYRNSENMLSIKYGNFARKVIFKLYHERLIDKWLSSKYWMLFKV
jgi:hypothetical protein